MHMNGDAERHRGMTTRIVAALKPHVADRGYDFEFHVDETERNLWMVNGLTPPPFKSEAEKLWFRENRPVEWEEAKGRL